MKNQALALTLSLLAVSAIACSPARAGELTRQARDLSGFDALEVSGAFDVQIERGDEFRVALIGEPEALEHVRTELSDRTLEIHREGLRFGGSDVKVRIVMPALVRVDTSGAVQVRARDLAGERLEIEASGASKLHLTGKVAVVRYELSGASKVDALTLEAESVQIDASGATRAKVRATERLTAEASGATHIRYAGAPETVNTDLSGASSVKRI